MTTIKQTVKASDVESEIKAIRETARRLTASKTTARRFLISTGIYSANGRLKPRYR